MVTPTTGKWNKQTSRYLNALDQINIHLVIYFWYCFVVMVLICSEKQKDYIYIPQRLIHVPYKGGAQGEPIADDLWKKGVFRIFWPFPPLNGYFWYTIRKVYKFMNKLIPIFWKSIHNFFLSEISKNKLEIMKFRQFPIKLGAKKKNHRSVNFCSILEKKVLICSVKQKDYIYIPQRFIHVPY